MATISIKTPTLLDELLFCTFRNKLASHLFSFVKVSSYLETLCDKVKPTSLRVLPKLHTPQGGITIRSLSHHLALCAAGEVSPRFILAPNALTSLSQETIQLLLVPWPYNLNDEDFVSVPGPLENLSNDFGFFEFRPRYRPKWPSIRFHKILQAAQNIAGRIDGVVLPELALTKSDFDLASNQVRNIPNPQIFISGVYEHEEGDKLSNMNIDAQSASVLALIALMPSGASNLIAKLHGEARQIGECIIDPTRQPEKPEFAEAAISIRQWAQLNRERRDLLSRSSAQ